MRRYEQLESALLALAAEKRRWSLDTVLTRSPIWPREDHFLAMNHVPWIYVKTARCQSHINLSLVTILSTSKRSSKLGLPVSMQLIAYYASIDLPPQCRGVYKYRATLRGRNHTGNCCHYFQHLAFLMILVEGALVCETLRELTRTGDKRKC